MRALMRTPTDWLAIQEAEKKLSHCTSGLAGLGQTLLSEWAWNSAAHTGGQEWNLAKRVDGCGY